MSRGRRLTQPGDILSHITSTAHPYDKATRTGSSRQASRQLFRLPLKKVEVCSVVLLALFMSSCVAHPQVRIEKGAAYFRTPLCRNVSSEELQKRMGRHFDSSRMASSIEDLKLNTGFSESDLEEVQGDDPDAYSEDVMGGEDKDDYADDEEEEEVEDESFIDNSDPYRYMRRRRDVKNNKEKPAGLYRNKRGSASDSSNPYLRLALSRKNKEKSQNATSRKQLKKLLRQKVRKTDKPPPWECKMRTFPVNLRDGFYPRIITDGKCETDKCFFRIYNCVPKKYRIKILQRDPNRCYPVPMISKETVFEEKWIFRHYYVTVGCNCERRKHKKRRRH